MYIRYVKLFGKTEEERPEPLVEELREKVSAARLPAHAQQAVERELDILSRTAPATAEFSIGLNYIEYVLSLPWNVKTEDIVDLSRAQRILDEEHFGLSDIKGRILEHLAVRRLKMDRKSKVLVVDDEEVARRNLEHILKKEGYSVVTAANGMEALEKISQKDFDVIVTDFRMEKMDGIEVIEQAKSRHPSVEVIMITGYASVATAVESMKKGAFTYIAKPFKIDEVRAAVRDALNKKSASVVGPSGSVLCFSGPPGTGKTSLGKAIARALGRKFSRISLGGIKDEAEIRGHRRTYAGAMPGRIIEEIRRTGSANPVLILDELDKIGADVKGDPASAMLELLDPEQNTNFMDHYLDIPFDLSGVIFIITANVADNILEPLRDRMEVLRFSGYTDEEKARIASNFLIPGQIREAGLSDDPPVFTEDAIMKIIREYTHEAGIRNLKREVSSVCRKIAREFVEQADRVSSVTVDERLVGHYLGPRKYYLETAGTKERIGVTTGLVWTEYGGEIIFVEAVRMKGRQELILTGSLGDVMRESAHTALSYVRSNAARLGIDENFFEGHDIHIHVPAGAIPKDGPSAGTTIALALISLLTGRPARRDVAVSGELTLRGRVLQVGGVKEKILAARRAKIKTVVLPEKNRVEAEGIIADIRSDIDIVFADTIDQAMDAAIGGLKT